MKRSRRLLKKKLQHICAMPECGRSVGKRGKVCPRCTSWWYYHNLQTAEEYARYLSRHQLAHSRILKRGRTR